MKEFSVFVESMRRLYRDGQVDQRKIVTLFESNKITQQEYDYIISAINEQ